MIWKRIAEQLAMPEQGPVMLRNARLPEACVEGISFPLVGDGLVSADLEIAKGRIRMLQPTGQGDGIDLAGSMVWPGTVDCHTHIDKGQAWARTPNPHGTFEAALDAAPQDRMWFSGREDLVRRAEFILKAAYAHGTTAIRSHVDAEPEIFDATFSPLKELAQERADRVHLQLAPFTGIGTDPVWVGELAVAAKDPASGVLSLFLKMEDGLPDFLDMTIRLADQHGLALDFHADENLDPNSNCLLEVARAVLRHGFEGPVLVGHCCAQSVHDEDTLRRTLDAVHNAGIGVVGLPMCNAYLQDRAPGRSPRHRGVAPVKEIAARDIPLALASDNVRDAFHAYGDMDLPELLRDSIRFLQLDHPVKDWPAAVTRAPAEMMGLADHGRLRTGAPADLILFPARNWSEFAARPLADRIVLRKGVAIDTTPPDFAELDILEGMQP